MKQTDIKKALEQAGIKVPAEINSEEIIKLFGEQKNEKFTVSVADMVKFMYTVGFPYSDFLECDRNGILKYLENNLKIEDESEKSGFKFGHGVKSASRKITDFFVGKDKKSFPFQVYVPENFEEAQELYSKLSENGCIEVIPQEAGVFNPSSDNVVYRTENSQGVDITQTDNIWLQFSAKVNKNFCMLVSAEDGALSGDISVFGSFLPNEQGTYYIEASSHNIRLNFDSTNYAYHLIFANEKLTRFYAVEMDIFTKVLPLDEHWLCIDFGTSNTTVGTWKDDRTHKLVAFDDCTTESKQPSFLLPSIAYVQKCTDRESLELLFGFEAKERLIEMDYQPGGTIFFNIKQWISADPDYLVSCCDEHDHTIQLKAHDIILMYLRYVVRQAEVKLKRHFVKLHFSAPIKLKARLFAITSETFKSTDGYTVASVGDSLDEGIAIMYERISELREEYIKNPAKNRGDVMIIDCGGGTTDVARCQYLFSYSDVGVKTQIKIRSENGQFFGGNELTYRIFQLLKIKLSDYYKSGAEKDKIQITNIDNLISTATDDYLNAVDHYIQQVIERKGTSFDYYEQLDRASAEAEWVLPTDFANKELVNGKEMIRRAKRNFNYLWDWAERIKIAFFSVESRATFEFNKEAVQTDKALYFYTDLSAEHKNQKSNLKKNESVPDVEINIKELSALLSPQIYYILSIMLLKADGSELIFDDKEMQSTRMLLAGQSCKISLFRDLMKEYIPGRRTRSGKKVRRTSAEMKLSCVNGCIQYLMEQELLNGETKIITDTPSIIYRVAVKTESFDTEKVLLDGRSIKNKSMDRIEIVQRPFAEGEIHYSVYNNIVNCNDAVNTGEVRIEPSLEHYREYNSLSEIMSIICSDAIPDIVNYKLRHEGRDESVISRLETDLNSIESDLGGKLLYFILPNSDGCGFVLWQIVKRTEEGQRKYYLSEPSCADYMKNTVASRFDGKNCITRN